MLDAAEAHWKSAGIEQQLHLERFSLKLAGEHAEGGHVVFKRSGKEIDLDGATTLLEAGEEAGITMPFGCRMGHDLDLERIRKGQKDKTEMRRQLRQIGRKIRRQAGKDYMLLATSSTQAGTTSVRRNGTMLEPALAPRVVALRARCGQRRKAASAQATCIGGCE